MWNEEGKYVTDCSVVSSTVDKTPPWHLKPTQMVEDTVKSEEKETFYDSGRVDSGFISSTNLLVSSEQCFSSELDPVSTSNSGLLVTSDNNSKSYMRLDSGVDVGIHEQFSQLSLTPSINNLSTTSSKDSKSNPLTTHNLTSSEGYASSITTPISPFEKSIEFPSARIQTQSPSKQVTWEQYFVPDNEGDNYLHIAVLHGFLEVVYGLISMIPNSSYLDSMNDNLQTALHLAVLTRQPRLVRRLVVSGALLDIQDRDGNTALHLACEVGDVDCLQAITMAVANQEIQIARLQYYPYRIGKGHEIPLHEINYDGQMCVHLAAMRGHMEIVRALSWLKADMNARELKSGRTALHYAAERGNVNIGRLLVEECGVSLEPETYAGYTPYQLSVWTSLELATELEKAGARPLLLPESESDSDSEMFQTDIAVY